MYIIDPCALVSKHYYMYNVYRSNILLDEKQQAKLSDFGFSIQLPQSVSRTTLVMAKDGLPGTSGYRPPEFSDCKYSVLSDIYSFGVVGYIFISVCVTTYCGVILHITGHSRVLYRVACIF